MTSILMELFLKSEQLNGLESLLFTVSLFGLFFACFLFWWDYLQGGSLSNLPSPSARVDSGLKYKLSGDSFGSFSSLAAETTAEEDIIGGSRYLDERGYKITARKLKGGDESKGANRMWYTEETPLLGDGQTSRKKHICFDETVLVVE